MSYYLIYYSINYYLLSLEYNIQLICKVVSCMRPVEKNGRVSRGGPGVVVAKRGVIWWEKPHFRSGFGGYPSGANTGGHGPAFATRKFPGVSATIDNPLLLYAVKLVLQALEFSHRQPKVLAFLR
jgi:hypothetical protein